MQTSPIIETSQGEICDVAGDVLCHRIQPVESSDASSPLDALKFAMLRL